MKITAMIEQRSFSSRKPTWMSDNIFLHLSSWYEAYCSEFMKCPCVSDLIDEYYEAVKEWLKGELEARHTEEEIEDMVSRSGLISLEDYINIEITRSIHMRMETIEKLVSDMYLKAGYSFEIDNGSAGFVIDEDLSVVDPWRGVMVLSPQIPVVRIIGITNEAIIRKGYAFAVPDYIEKQRRE